MSLDTLRAVADSELHVVRVSGWSRILSAAVSLAACIGVLLGVHSHAWLRLAIPAVVAVAAYAAAYAARRRARARHRQHLAELGADVPERWLSA